MPTQVEILSTVRGHTTMHFEDVAPEERAKLAEVVDRLLKDGHAIFLIKGQESHRIKGYDAEANEWIVFASTVPAPRATVRMSGRRSRVTVVANTSGG